MLKDKRYLSKIKTFDKDNSQEIILNGSALNAQMLFNQIIKGANKTINIISEELALYDTKKIRTSLENALIKNVKVQILLDGANNSNLTNNKFFQICHLNPNCEIRTTITNMHAHIITRDGKAYRYCVKSEDNSAIASFNGLKVAENADNKIFSQDNYKQFPIYI